MYIQDIEPKRTGGLFAGPKGMVLGPYGGWSIYGNEDEIRPIGILAAMANADAEDMVGDSDLTGLETSAF